MNTMQNLMQNRTEIMQIHERIIKKVNILNIGWFEFPLVWNVRGVAWII